MATYTFDTTVTPSATRHHVISTRDNWADAWAVRDDLYCTEATWSVAPTLPTASFVRPYGWLRRHDDQTFAQVDKEDLNGKYVRIVFDMDETIPSQQTRTWVGRFELDSDVLQGARDHLGNWVAEGDQTIEAFGLEKLLADHLIVTSVWHDGTQEVTSDRVVPFNRSGDGNRTLGQMTFEQYRAGGTDWLTEDIVDYLLEHQTPLDETGAKDVPFKKHPTAANVFLPDWDRPEIDPERQTTYSVLNQLISPQRGMVWWLEYFENGAGTDELHLRTESMVKTAIVLNPLAGPPTFPAAQTQVELEFDEDPATQASVKNSDVEKVDQVVCRGERRRSVGSFAIDDSSLSQGWSVGLEAQYTAGLTGHPNYGTWSANEKTRRTLQFLATPQFKRVFRSWQVSEAWSGKVKDGVAGVWNTSQALMPENPMFPDDNVANVATIPYPRERFIEPYMPLREGVNYIGTVVSAGTVTHKPDNEPLPPQVYLLQPKVAGAPDVWVDATKAGSAAIDIAPENSADAQPFSAFVNVPFESNRIEINANNAPPWALNATALTTSQTDVQRTAFDGNKMIVTLSMEDDRWCEGSWPAGLNPADTIKRKYIYAAGFTKDYVAPGTVVGVDEDGNLEHSTGGYIPAVGNDDNVQKLTAIARLAATWYTETRRVLTLKSHRFPNEDDLPLGALITEIGDQGQAGGHRQDINSTITQITITVPFEESEQPTDSAGLPTFEFQTQSGELDVMQVAPVDPTRV